MTARLREALEDQERLCAVFDSWALSETSDERALQMFAEFEPDALHRLADAAREFLTLREAGALIITPPFPELAIGEVPIMYSAEKRLWLVDFDALRDAMPPEDAK